MSLDTGQKLGPYEIVAAIGAGGMGEVYRARDTRLDREVAIKVLPAHLTSDDIARQRLEREAKAVSALSHPHICTLYDLGHEGEVDYLVMEYLEGETLSERLDRQPLGTDEVLRYAIQIADALDKAHREGVVHRDLKPGNIMLSTQGAKLLDFGLATTVEAAAGTSDLAATPTRTSPLTAAGSIVGTFQYMAPEQLEGQPADKRSDIFAFGSVLFEMITGKRAFEGKTQAGLIASIIEREPPDVTSLQPLAPPALDRLVANCLAKDPDERRQSMHDVLLDLRWIAEAGSQAGVPAPLIRRRRVRAGLAWVVAAAFAITAVALGAALWMGSADAPPTIVSKLLPPDGVRLDRRGIALSPDGRRIAYVGSEAAGPSMLRVLELATGRSRPLPGTEGARNPFWSPDSQSLGFFAGGELRRIQVAAGSSLRISSADFGVGGTWNEEGVIVFAPSPSEGLRRVSASGGESVQLFAAENEAHVFPVFLPGGNRFLYVSYKRAEQVGTIRAASLDGKLEADVGVSESRVSYAAGHLLYASEGTLISQPFDPSALTLSGEPRAIAESVASHTTSGTGMLAYLDDRAPAGSQLNGYDREGRQQTSVFSPVRLDDLALSHDGKRLAMSRRDADNPRLYDVWTYDLLRDVFTRVTFDGRADDPVWSADGKWLIYSRNPGLYRVRASGAGEPELVLDSSADDVCHDWAWEGNQVLFSRLGDKNQLDLWSLEIGAGAEPRPVLAGGFDELQAELSPDGRWLAYASGESGELEVYVMDWPELTDKWQISTTGGGMPRWRGDGRELYYVSSSRELVAVAVAGDAANLVVGDDRVLFETRIDPDSRSHDYVVIPDGERFLFIEAPPDTESGPDAITLVQQFLRSSDGG